MSLEINDAALKALMEARALKDAEDSWFVRMLRETHPTQRYATDVHQAVYDSVKDDLRTRSYATYTFARKDEFGNETWPLCKVCNNESYIAIPNGDGTYTYLCKNHIASTDYTTALDDLPESERLRLRLGDPRNAK